MPDTSLIIEALPSSLDPVSCCDRLSGLPYRLFLDSAAREHRASRYSFVTADPFAVVRRRHGATEYVDQRSGVVQHLDGSPVDVVAQLLARHPVASAPGLPPFLGGAAGYLGYEWASQLERVPRAAIDDLGLDDVVLGVYDWVLAWDHHTDDAWLIANGLPETDPAARRQRAATRAAEVRQRLLATPSGGEITTARASRRHAPSFPVTGGWWPAHLPLRSSFTRQGYLDAIQTVRDYILAGDIFQANLSQRFEAPLADDPWLLYRRLRADNPAPFAAYFETRGSAVLSVSPERFLRVQEGGVVDARPIKGTRPRGGNAVDDAAFGHALLGSAKDRAENLMIVDVMRNDLSRVCAPRSVRVPELFALERHSAVQHLVSTVTGTLEPPAGPAELLHATFPGASITGAPKLRAIEIIAELEPVTRGVYCGAIGYWSVTGALDLNIAIRTAVTVDGRVLFGAGGGIVADSVADDEYAETLAKARGIIDTLAGAG